MGKATYFFSGLGLIAIAYVGYLSCTTQWPLQPLNYCATFTPFLQPCSEKVAMIGDVMFYLMVFGGLLVLYSLVRLLWPSLSAIAGGTKTVVNESSYYAGAVIPTNKKNDKVPTEIIAKTEDNNHYTIILQRVDNTEPLRNKPVRVTIKNNVLNLMTNNYGQVFLELSRYITGPDEKEFTVEFLGDEYFKYSMYKLIQNK